MGRQRPQRNAEVRGDAPDRAAAVLRHAPALMLASRPAQVLLEACRAAAEVTGAEAIYATCRARLDGDDDLEVAWRGRETPLSPTARSALSAVHRQLEPRPAAVALEDPAVRAALGAPALAVPLAREERLVGEIVAVSPDGSWPEGTEEALVEVARLAAAALGNVERYASARRDQERLRFLADAAEDVLWDWTPGTDDVWWGGRIADFVGQDEAASPHGLSWWLGRIHPDDVDRVRTSIEAALASDCASWRARYRFRREGGEWSIFEDRASILREVNGRPYRLVGSMRDETEREGLLGREQAARAEAEAANRAKDEFLAMLGHELRNPLAPILTAVHLLRLRELPEIERERQVVERQATHLMRLVDDLLDVSRVTRGQVELHRERVEVADVVSKAVEMASPLVDARRHHLAVEVPRHGLLVDADPSRLAQVVTNLLTNAARYTPPGGHIRISARADDGRVELAVRDDGVGIAAEMLPRVFDVFVQERQPLDRAEGGLGVGLAIARTVVALHGGDIEARSEGKGRGSEFVVRLPLANGATPEAAPAPAAEAARTGIRILVVDDNRDAADLLGEYLASIGHETRVAYDGLAALEEADEFRPDLAILDIGLPVMDGYEVARHLRRREHLQPLRLVAVTGYGQESDRAQAQAASFDAHFVKPVSLDELDEAIRDLCAGLREPELATAG